MLLKELKLEPAIITLLFVGVLIHVGGKLNIIILESDWIVDIVTQFLNGRLITKLKTK